MKNLIHKTITDIKYLYPCIAYDESHTDTELTIVTETRLSKIYPVKKTVNGMTSIGEDYWGRYSFRDENDQYFCEIDGQLYFKGNDMDGEPHYPVKEIINYEFPDIDKELIEFKPLIDKVRQYIEKETEMELIESTPSLQLNSNNILDSKIFCSYKLKL